MADLSPEAQAVFDAFCAEARPEPHHQRDAIAAALRAAAGELAYGHGSGDPIINEHDLLAIADELEAP